MPIYEFRCLKCDECFEMLVMDPEETVEARCPKCKSEDFERIMSAASYTVGSGSNSPGAATRTRTCASGSCTTYDIPGPA